MVWTSQVFEKKLTLNEVNFRTVLIMVEMYFNASKMQEYEQKLQDIQMLQEAILE